MTPLNSIYGQHIAKNILLNSLNRDRLASTYLFYGDDGLGKWLMVVALASLVNCEKPVKNESGDIVDSCGDCLNCRQIQNLGFPELHFALPIPPHKNELEAIALNLEYIEQKRKEPFKIITSTRQITIPIDVAREIKRKTAIKPPAGVKRVILFYQMERMLGASADSLLKLIEEPPPETIIVLTAKDPENLLPTIQSRAQKIRFGPIAEPEISGYLMDKYELTSEKAQFAARLSEGSIGRALSFIMDENESSMRQTSFLMFKALFQKDNSSAAAIVNEFINPNNKGETEQILSSWQSFLSDLILLKYGRDPSEILNIDLSVELENLANRISNSEDFCHILKEIKQMNISLRRNVHIRPAMTALALNLRKYIVQSA